MPVGSQIARFAAGLVVGILFGWLAIAVLGMAVLASGGGTGGAGGLVSILLLVHGGVAIAAGVFGDWRFGFGYFVGPTLLITYLLAQPKPEETRRAAAIPLASKEPPTFSLEHRLVELADYKLPNNTGGLIYEEGWLHLLGAYQVQTRSGAELAAYRKGMGSECWQEENIAQTLRLLRMGLFRGLPEDTCMVQMEARADADAIVIVSGSEAHHYGLKLQDGFVNSTYFIGERLDGTFNLRTRVVFVGGNSGDTVRPKVDRCRTNSAGYAAICMATSLNVPHRFDGKSSAPPSERARIATKYIDHPNAEVRDLAKDILASANQSLATK